MDKQPIIPVKPITPKGGKDGKKPKYSRPPILNFATFLMVLGIIGTVFSIVAYFSLILAVAYYLVMGCIIIVTLGLIMLDDGFMSFFLSGSDFVSHLSLSLNDIAPYSIITSMVLIFLSGLIAVLGRRKHRDWKAILITNIVFMVVLTALLVIWIGFLSEILSQF